MEYNSPEFRKWLDKLQRESWQLELIISGFAIYGLFAGYDAVEISRIKASVSGNMPVGVFWIAMKSIWSILTFNLILHVLLRGLWIGAVGLRYVSGDIDYTKLNYSEKFTKYLRKKVGSFDRYIAQLENYCSILFAITFLLIFYILGAFIVFFIFLAVGLLLSKISILEEERFKFIQEIVGWSLVFGTLVVFIDFIGQGFLKKGKRTSKLYFPIYWLFSKMTLSFLYRPLAYNFLDNKFGRRLSFWLVPIYVCIVTITGIFYKESAYISNRGQSSEGYAHNSNYEDESTSETAFVKIAVIPSKLIRENQLKIFMVHNESIEDYVLEENDTLKESEDKRGFTHFFIENVTVAVKGKMVKEGVQAESLKEYLKTLNQLYELQINSIEYDSDFIASKNIKNQLGFETYLNIQGLSEGKNILTITGPSKENSFDKDSKTVEKTLVTIPFWYFPE